MIGHYSIHQRLHACRMDALHRMRRDTHTPVYLYSEDIDGQKAYHEPLLKDPALRAVVTGQTMESLGKLVFFLFSCVSHVVCYHRR